MLGTVPWSVVGDLIMSGCYVSLSRFREHLYRRSILNPRLQCLLGNESCEEEEEEEARFSNVLLTCVIFIEPQKVRTHIFIHSYEIRSELLLDSA